MTSLSVSPLCCSAEILIYYVDLIFQESLDKLQDMVVTMLSDVENKIVEIKNGRNIHMAQKKSVVISSLSRWAFYVIAIFFLSFGGRDNFNSRTKGYILNYWQTNRLMDGLAPVLTARSITGLFVTDQLTPRISVT